MDRKFFAIGLAYEDSEDHAPEIAVKGVNYEAQEIVKIANRYNIPVVIREDLAKTLQKFEVDSQIPDTLYHAIAVVFKEIS